MKYPLFLLLLVCVSGHLKAETLINADGKKESQACIDATKTSMTIKALQKKYDLTMRQMNALACNGIPIKEFVEKYQVRNDVSDTLKVFTFSQEVGNVETELCIAAATSNEVLKLAMEKHQKTKMYIADLTCNELPIKKFAKRYGNKEFNIR